MAYVLSIAPGPGAELRRRSGAGPRPPGVLQPLLSPIPPAPSQGSLGILSSSLGILFKTNIFVRGQSGLQSLSSDTLLSRSELEGVFLGAHRPRCTRFQFQSKEPTSECDGTPSPQSI